MKEISEIFLSKNVINKKIKIRACFSLFNYFLLSVTDFCEISSSKFPNHSSREKFYMNTHLFLKTTKEFFSLNTQLFSNQKNAEQYLKVKFKSEISNQQECKNLLEQEIHYNNPELEFLKLVVLDLDSLLFDRNDCYIGEQNISSIEKALHETLELSHDFYLFAPKTSKALHATFKKKLHKKQKNK